MSALRKPLVIEKEVRHHGGFDRAVDVEAARGQLRQSGRLRDGGQAVKRRMVKVRIDHQHLRPTAGEKCAEVCAARRGAFSAAGAAEQTRCCAALPDRARACGPNWPAG